MKANTIAALSGFLVVALLFALIVWAGGFNFDRRDVDVGIGTFWCIFISGTGGFLAVAFYGKAKE